MKLSLNRLIALNTERVSGLARELHAKSPRTKLTAYSDRLDVLQVQIKNAVYSRIEGKRQLLIGEMNRIDALSPLKVLTRGYSIVTDASHKTVIDVNDVQIGDRVKIKLHKGKITAKVEERYD
jgi:exodeoxyribonuclease VII large subunit